MNRRRFLSKSVQPALALGVVGSVSTLVASPGAAKKEIR